MCIRITTIQFFIVATCFLFVKGKNPELPLGRFLYEDLKCIPKVDTDTSQPAYYKCDVSATKGCIFEGKEISVGEEIKGKETDFYCRSHCSCNEEGSFDCAEDDCFEENQEGCRLTDSLNECCSILNCEPPQSNCTYKGKTYEDGRTFRPEQTCQTCLCQKGFNGKLEPPYCMKKKCLEQIFNMHALQNNCAAVYFLEDLCCPATWVCDKGQKIEEINQSNQTKLSCNFGQKTVPLGQGFETTVRPYSKIVPVKCECTLPPFITCLEK